MPMLKICKVIFVVIIAATWLAPISSQPILDPGSTVDPASGRMMFKLPLGAVHGSGIDYPLDLSYAAGIQYYQEASAVGLGFSFDPPSISRSAVFVPDDNYGTSAKFDGYSPVKIICEDRNISILGHVLRFLFSGGASIFVPKVDNDISMQTGGAPGQTVEYNLNDGANKGTGFFRGGKNDLPDIYIVNTPWVSGKLLWVGDYQTGHFSFAQTSGAGFEQGKSTVKVEYFKYDKDNPTAVPAGGKFIITTTDGTRLFFELSDAYATSMENHIELQNNGDECTADGFRKVKEAAPVRWWLTKVLTNKYNGGADPENSTSSGWVVLKYTAAANLAIFRKTIGENLLSAGLLNSNILSSIGKAATDYDDVRFCKLDRIVTPNEHAVYTYGGFRTDVTWRKTANQAVVYDSVCPVLRTVSLYGKNNALKQTIQFNTDYLLRPKTFGSRATEGKSLTLVSVVIGDGVGNQLPPVKLHYDLDIYNSNKDALEYRTGTNDFGDCFIANRDIWGYYFQNFFPMLPTWHAAGIAENPAAKAWSLSGITLPGGMNIGWEYEENRYDSANGGRARENSITCGSTTVPAGAVKYGGGIRVKKVQFDNGLQTNSISYYYSEDVGAVIDMVNSGTNTPLASSGHAACEPIPSMTLGDNTCNDDKRADRAKGGLYTETEVQYGKTIVIKEPLSANGALVYEHYTTADFPNTGKYGDCDKSWKRGHLKSKSLYNSSKKLIMREDYTYDFVEQQQTHRELRWSMFDEKYWSFLNERCGWVKRVGSSTRAGGVTTGSQMKYAPDITTTTPDDLPSLLKEATTFDAGNGIQAWSSPMGNLCRAVAVRTDIFGTDAVKDDYILIRTAATPLLYMDIGKDLNGSGRAWSATKTYGGINEPYYVIGASLFTIADGNDSSDLIVVVNNFDLTYYLNVYVFHDIYLDGNQIRYRESDPPKLSPSVTRIKVDPTNLRANDYPVGCIIGDFYGSGGKPDFLIITNGGEQRHFPGDVVDTVLSDPAKGRRIRAVMNFEEAAYRGGDKTMTLWGTDSAYVFYGNSGYFTDADSGGVQNDLAITGPGCFSGGSTGLYSHYRPLHSQVFKNINLNTAGKISFGTACNRCGTILLNDQPVGGSVWDEMKLAGVFNEQATDRQQFVYFREANNAKCYFHIVDYVPITYLVDYDGRPNRTYAANSDGIQMMTVEIPACWKYPLMGNYDSINNKHLLSQTCGVLTYRYPNGTTILDDLSAQNDKVVMAKAMTWAELNGIWLPRANYVWRVPMSATGVSTVSYIPFNYTSPASRDTSWKLTDSICSCGVST